ncbi:protein of unknown function [Oenococcus oeni]|nr:hypothetical protein OENI_110041 [Oenococcus oeni]SYW01065.1 hypothetical protein OENI_30243 [Oenococcus oeni]SYW02490.1 hypothetical protein OENI_370015 [Oenococcus oeni]SYW14469.1 hypothetical protein OENI_500013 [Oenococcus oeni]SYW18431.1 hypothetical protein OENI_30245 [Oenococcus oeni]
MKYSKIKKVSQDRMIENTFETLVPLVSNFDGFEVNSLINCNIVL